MTSKFPPVALPDHPYLRVLRDHCLSFPGAYEDYPWGDVVYKVGSKIFAFLGVTDEPAGLTVKASPADAEVLVQLPHVSRARYVGKYGWVTLQIGDEQTLALTKELIATSYDLVCGAARQGARRSRAKSSVLSAPARRLRPGDLIR